jgi:hypothetical protein
MVKYHQNLTLDQGFLPLNLKMGSYFGKITYNHMHTISSLPEKIGCALNPIVGYNKLSKALVANWCNILFLNCHCPKWLLIHLPKLL